MIPEVVYQVLGVVLMAWGLFFALGAAYAPLGDWIVHQMRRIAGTARVVTPHTHHFNLFHIEGHPIDEPPTIHHTTVMLQVCDCGRWSGWGNWDMVSEAAQNVTLAKLCLSRENERRESVNG